MWILLYYYVVEYCHLVPVANSNLDSQTKEIYRKNIQIRDALEMHTEDAERLKKVRVKQLEYQVHIYNTA